jgi:hypothetical protein
MQNKNIAKPQCGMYRYVMMELTHGDKTVYGVGVTEYDVISAVRAVGDALGVKGMSRISSAGDGNFAVAITARMDLELDDVVRVTNVTSARMDMCAACHKGKDAIKEYDRVMAAMEANKSPLAGGSLALS